MEEEYGLTLEEEQHEKRKMSRRKMTKKKT